MLRLIVKFMFYKPNPKMLSFETCNTDDKTVKSVKLYSPVLTASKQQ